MGSNEEVKVSLSFVADTSKAETSLRNLKKSLDSLVTAPANINFLGSDDLVDSKALKEASKAAAELEKHLSKAYNANTGKLDMSRFSLSLKNANKDLNYFYSALKSGGAEGEAAFLNLAKAISTAESPTIRLSKQMDGFLTTLKNTAKWQLTSGITHGVVSTFQSAVRYAEDLNESLTNIRIVTGQNTDQMAKFAKEANKAAKTLGTTTKNYTDASLIFYQQGLGDEDVKSRTDVVTKMANVTGEAAADVSSYMTAIWNNFADGSHNLEYYADVITALGASTASSSEEIAEGLEKFASIGDTVGLSYEYATSALAAVVANTRQSADTVGTAFKTLFARLQGLKLGETLEDGVDLNKYSQALESVGVKVLDMNGELREADDILDDTAEKWDNLTKAQQTALAQTVAGTRQYSQFVALMESWDDVQNNLITANNASGSLQEQQKIYAEGWEAARKRVKAAFEGLYDDLIDDDFLIGVLNFTEKFINAIDKIVESLGGLGPIISTISGIFLQKFAKEMPAALNNFTSDIIRPIAANFAPFKKVRDWGNKPITEAQDTTISQIEERQKNVDKDSIEYLELDITKKQIEQKRELGRLSSQISKERREYLEQEIEISEVLGQQLLKTKALEQESKKTVEEDKKDFIKTASEKIKKDNETHEEAERKKQEIESTRGSRVAEEEKRREEINKKIKKEEENFKIKQAEEELKRQKKEKIEDKNSIAYRQADIEHQKAAQASQNSKNRLNELKEEQQSAGEISAKEKINQEIEKEKSQIKDVANYDQNFTQENLKEYVKEYGSLIQKSADLNQAWKNNAGSPEAIQTNLNKIKEESLEINKQGKDIDEVKKKYKDYIKSVSNGKLDEEFKDINEIIEKLGKNTGKITDEDLENLNQEIEKVINNLQNKINETENKAAEIKNKIESHTGEGSMDVLDADMRESAAYGAIVNSGEAQREVNNNNIDENLKPDVKGAVEAFGQLTGGILQAAGALVTLGSSWGMLVESFKSGDIGGFAAGFIGLTEAVLTGVPALKAVKAAFLEIYAICPPLLIAIGAISIAIGAIAIAVIAFQNHAQRFERALKNATESAEKARNRFKELAQATNELQSSVKNWNSRNDALKGLTEGTEEYAEALKAANEEAEKLIEANDLKLSNGDFHYEGDQIVFDSGVLENLQIEAKLVELRAEEITFEKEENRLEAEANNLRNEFDINYKGENKDEIIKDIDEAIKNGITSYGDYQKQNREKTDSYDYAAEEYAKSMFKNAADQMENVIESQTTKYLELYNADDNKDNDITKEEARALAEMDYQKGRSVNAENILSGLTSSLYKYSINDTKILDNKLKENGLLKIGENSAYTSLSNDNDGNKVYAFDDEKVDIQKLGLLYTGEKQSDSVKYVTSSDGDEKTLARLVKDEKGQWQEDTEFAVTTLSEALLSVANRIENAPTLESSQSKLEYAKTLDNYGLDYKKDITTVEPEQLTQMLLSKDIKPEEAKSWIIQQQKIIGEAAHEAGQQPINLLQAFNNPDFNNIYQEEFKKFIESRNEYYESLVKNQGWSKKEIAELQQYRAELIKTHPELASNADAANKVSIANLKMNRGITDLAKSWDEYNNVMSNSNSSMEDKVSVMADLAPVMQDVLNLTEEEYSQLSPDFLTNNWKTIQDVMNNVEGSIDDLRDAASRDIITKIEGKIVFDEVDVTIKDLQQQLESYDDLNLEIGVSIDDAAVLSTFEKMTAAMDIAKEHTADAVSKIQAYYRSLGYDVELVWEEARKWVSDPNSPYDDGHMVTGGAWAVKVVTPNGSYGGGTGVSTTASKSATSGGKSKTKETKDTKKYDDEFDRYHDINEALEDIAQTLQSVDKYQSHVFGKELAASLRNENELLVKQQGLLEQKLAMQKQEAAELQGTLAQTGLAFDQSSGQILNYAQATAQALEELNAAIQKFNASAQSEADKLALEAAQKTYDEFKKAISRYDALVDEMRQSESEIEDIYYSKLENELKAWNAEVQIQLDLDDARRTWHEFVNNITKDFKSVFRDIGKDMSSMIDQAGTFMGEKGTINVSINAANDIMRDIDMLMAGGSSNKFASVSEAQEELKNYNDKLQQSAEDLYNLYEDAWDAYLEGVDQAIDKLDDLLNQYDRIDDDLDHQSKLIELLYGDQAYNLLGQLYSAQTNNLLGEMDSLRQQIDFYRSQYDNAVSEYGADSEAAQKWKDSWEESIDELHSKEENYIEAIKNKSLNAINEAFNSLEKKMTSGESLSWVSEQWDDALNAAEGYYDEVERIYQLESLERKWQKAINDTSSVKAQQQLKFIMEDQLSSLENKTKLSEYDVELAEKKLAVYQAQIALEEAQNNKTSMKLVRGTDGNWSYQYIADSDEIAAKQEDLLKKQQEYYEFTKKSWQDLTQKITEDTQTAIQRIQELEQESLTASTERQAEIAQQIEYLKDYYWGDSGIITLEMKDYAEYERNLNKATAESLWALYDTDVENYTSMSDKEKELIDDLKDHGVNSFFELYTAISENYDDIQDKCEDINKQSLNTWNTTANEMIRKWNSNDEDSIKTQVEQALDKCDKAIVDFTNSIQEGCQVAGENFADVGQMIQLDQVAITSLEGQTVQMINTTLQGLNAYGQMLAQIQSMWAGVIQGILTATAAIQQYLAYESAARQFNNNSSVGSSGSYTNRNSNNNGSSEPSPSTKDTPNQYYYQTVTDDGYTGASGVVQGTLSELKKKFGDQGGAVSIYYYDKSKTTGKGSFVTTFDTGGYTGDWGGGDGRLAMLHSKELVLNKDDTKNILSAVDIIRQITNIGDSVANAIAKGISNMMNSLIGLGNNNKYETYNTNTTNNNGNNNTFEITMNVDGGDVNEIQQAILNLPNLASQFLGRK